MHPGIGKPAIVS